MFKLQCNSYLIIAHFLYFFRIVALFEEMATELVQQNDFTDPVIVEVDNLVFAAIKVSKISYTKLCIDSMQCIHCHKFII